MSGYVIVRVFDAQNLQVCRVAARRVYPADTFWPYCANAGTPVDPDSRRVEVAEYLQLTEQFRIDREAEYPEEGMMYIDTLTELIRSNPEAAWLQDSTLVLTRRSYA